MAQTAYDFARFETKQKQEDKKVQLRSVAGGKNKVSNTAKVLGKIRTLSFAIILVIACVGLLQSRARITELSQDIQLAEKNLTTEQNINSYLLSELAVQTNMENVDNLAEDLGLVKMDESQVTYIRLDNEAVVETPESFWQKISTNAQEIVGNISAFFNP